MSHWTDWKGPEPSLGLVVLLPGRGYTCSMPLLNFAGQVAIHHGWDVRAVSWEASESWGPERVGHELAAAIGEHPGPVRVIGKSLGTMAAPYAAQQRIDAVWLTPLLTLPAVTRGIQEHPGRQLLVGGTGDTMTWDGRIAAALAADALDADVLEIPEADHGMQVPDPVRTAEIHVEVVRAIDGWFTAGDAARWDDVPARGAGVGSGSLDARGGQ
ncbi:hypothetical protein ACT3SP_12690 [Brachybacterium sp. AOP43-C2-M15]|uniref:hypothetical protein n=1 Tax=Brachybacterium sp. AOP43-C2-M15 TaxID=3457661 RepID=UPI0040339207